MPSISIGQRICHQFRVDAFIASGGMGAVYRVWDLQRNVPLAMKVLHADLAEEPVMLSSFRREARSLQKLAHPNIVPFYGLYEEEDGYFLLERFIEGQTLKEILRKRGGRPLTPAEALPFLKTLSSALGYAHANGLVHCDIKPGNVMVEQNGTIYLTDFGVARHSQSTTTTFAGAGTPAYMAPEQIRSDAVMPETDIYSLGVMLYELLTGQRPFTGNENGAGNTNATSGERIRQAHLQLTPPDPCRINPALPSGLAQVLLTALQKSPQRRFHSMSELFSAACSAAGYRESDIPSVSMLREVKTDNHGPVTPPDAHISNHGPVIPGPAGDGRRKKMAWVIIAGAAVFIFILILATRPGGGSHNTPGNPVFPMENTLGVDSNQQSLPQESNDPQNGIQNSTAVSLIYTEPTRTVVVDNQFPSATPLQLSTAPDFPQPVVEPTSTDAPPQTSGDRRTNPIDQAALVLVRQGSFWQGLDAQLVDILLGQCSRCTQDNYADAMPMQQVTLDAFWIYQTEVTNRQYASCVDQGSCSPPQKYTARGKTDYYARSSFADYPVVYVTWADAAQYCAWAGGSLPGEAQWEKAARGGSDQRLYPWGNQYPEHNLANVDGYLGSPNRAGAYPQGASPYGALDMAGNVYEWIQDWYTPGYGSVDPGIISTSNERVIRGGSEFYRGAFAAVSFRDKMDPNQATDQIGFRCVVAP
jgi:eukaryotic-like serine/threonine-protein kinase